MSESYAADLPALRDSAAAARPVDLPQNLPLIGGGVDFEITPGWRDEAWYATNGRIGVTVISSADNNAPSKSLDGFPALIWKQNCIKKPMGSNSKIPYPHRTQTLMAELNGVFFHLVERDGHIAIVIADERLNG